MQTCFEDNHMGESFLEHMIMNANVVKRDMIKVMQDSVSISQYLCIVALVLLVWIYTLRSTLDESSLLLLDVSLLVSGFLILVLTEEMISLNLLFHYILNISFFITDLYVLAPIYQTLMRSISSDSIWAVTISLLILHLFLHDYSGSTINAPGALQNPTLNSCISLNASVVASVFIASCLPSRLHVFAIMVFSLLVFLFCSTSHILCKEILLPFTPFVLIYLDVYDIGFRFYAALVTFHLVLRLVGFCDCGMPLLAYTDSRIQI
ncbi:hypothetical protein Pint_36579 [Pistacia integerrima]|uniref:Uncharacterized protein n=1 Tax=Pistacia integerrima TaxID=434235 RepID=A0ACC0Y520_9ROSI|nr:hypothetical protein Pint_36579 [Pistacia integerrima]